MDSGDRPLTVRELRAAIADLDGDAEVLHVMDEDGSGESELVFKHRGMVRTWVSLEVPL